MMAYRNKLITLVSINGALALLVLAGLLFSPAKARSRGEALALPKDAAAVSRIELGGPALALSLSRQGDAWSAQRSGQILPAVSSRVEAFLEQLTGLGRLDVAARSRSSWESLGLEGEEASSVRLYGSGGEILADLALGSYAPAGGQLYLAFADGEKAYLAPGTLGSYVRAADSSWLELAILSDLATAESVQSLKLSGRLPDGAGGFLDYDYGITRSDSGWSLLDGPGRLDHAKAETMVRQLVALKGADFAPAGEKPGEPVLTVGLSLGNGGDLTLNIEEAMADGRFPLTLSQKPGLRWYVSAYSLKDALKTLSALSLAE